MVAFEDQGLALGLSIQVNLKLVNEVNQKYKY